MEEDGGGREPVEEVPAEEVNVVRTFTDEDGIINAEIFLHPQIQVIISRLFTKVFAQYPSIGGREDRTPTDKWVRGAVNKIRKLFQTMLGGGVVEHRPAVYFLKLHPLALINLMRTCFSDIYN